MHARQQARRYGGKLRRELPQPENGYNGYISATIEQGGCWLGCELQHPGVIGACCVVALEGRCECGVGELCIDVYAQHLRTGKGICNASGRQGVSPENAQARVWQATWQPLYVRLHARGAAHSSSPVSAGPGPAGCTRAGARLQTRSGRRLTERRSGICVSKGRPPTCNVLRILH